MSDPNLKDLLNRLQDALDRTESVDEETLQLVKELDEDINRLIETGAEGDDYDNLVERAQSVETRFAVDHPVAERFLREIIDALARIGI
ncbi:MAG: DUF4404 family protein [Xanthomonadales bacterium]|jgi:hypothetical protein|nr:DUF4404 family protein [Gammaproteobacteria bacterium]MBT8064134.1 DUF4404 family protein [Gammaproteobacteria bacterium]NNJ65370.1 DUF4404 family protein [Xanthomonadales bacterium]NNK33431.1 DUF4404 family protein [Xanthomonadales bacterium]NNK37228.1 DUF4404 family protein [Xanthomonadales bacterium]